ncbi:amino acid ABC transporter permease [Agrobacterium sp. NPDC089420]|uniref:amino acid ABC transporter permease n=1 Tax=Agrobacterium sp. NPDC089420 TaxID=3363918 RepID=UPI00384E61B4
MDFLSTFLNMDVLRSSGPMLINGLVVTILLGTVSLLLSIVIGLFLVFIRLYAINPLKILAVIYIDLFRAIPLLVLLVLIYFALPFLGPRLSSFWAAAAALSLVAGAYMAETFRAGIEAVPRGQFEAAKALGFTWPKLMIDIILPQAMRIVVPPATGIAVGLVKDTALASVVALPDLLKQATQTQAFYANPSPLIGAAALYLLLLVPLVRIVALLEAKKLHRA